MVFMALQVALAHGSNDVANSISPLITTLRLANVDLKLGLVIGATGIAFGLMCLGYKTMETVGNKVIKLDFQKGYCAQFATALSVLTGSDLGLPISTTHCMVGSLLGLALASRIPFVKEVYESESEGNELQLGTVGRIVLWWLLTVPIGFGTSFLLTKLIL